MNLQEIVNRRTEELYSSTRSEFLAGIAAALLFVGVMALRFAPDMWRSRWPGAHDRLLQIGLAAVIAWAAVSVYRFRKRIRRQPPRADEAAASGVAYYRKELERRRDHLRDPWLWHGPLILACLVLMAVVMGRDFMGMAGLRKAVPLIVLLAGWTGFDMRRRRRQVRELQREIEEIESV